MSKERLHPRGRGKVYAMRWAVRRLLCKRFGRGKRRRVQDLGLSSLSVERKLRPHVAFTQSVFQTSLAAERTSRKGVEGEGKLHDREAREREKKDETGRIVYCCFGGSDLPSRKSQRVLSYRWYLV